MDRYVYAFTEGSRDMADLLGGKGANLAEPAWACRSRPASP